MSPTSTTPLPRTRNVNIMGKTDAVGDYWVERLGTPVARLERLGRRSEHAHKSSLGFMGDELRHYGWWTLAQGIRDGRGHTRLVVVNGDRYAGGGGYGPSTSARTMQAETAARDAGFECREVAGRCAQRWQATRSDVSMPTEPRARKMTSSIA
jgi:hypothetical protein